MSALENTNLENTNMETHTEVHHWPHIPKIQWKQISDSFYGITTVTFTTLFFAVLVFLFVLKARSLLKTNKKSRLRAAIASFVKFFDDYLQESFWYKSLARKKYSLIVWVFFIILFGNLFWLIIDFIWTAFPIIFNYLRPIHSDLNTTLALGAWTIMFAIYLSIKYHWVWHTAKWYFFNWTWKWIMEKMINVFVWWLHLISQFAAVTSLSLRLFGNIFAWMVLISVIWFLGLLMSESFFEVGRIITLPFWFFELFVAFVQAIVFAGLMIAYFKQSIEGNH